MTTFQLTVDCSDPDRLARFWPAALDYDLQGPPDGHDSWRAFWLSVGVPEDEVEDGYDAIIDPTGYGPRIWFQRVPEAKSRKNRMHVDLLVGGGRGVALEERREHVEAAVDRLVHSAPPDATRWTLPIRITTPWRWPIRRQRVRRRVKGISGLPHHTVPTGPSSRTMAP